MFMVLYEITQKFTLSQRKNLLKSLEDQWHLEGDVLIFFKQTIFHNIMSGIALLPQLNNQ